MLTEITGDLVKVREGIICHQVNYYGVMGGGVAAAIADKILTKDQYMAYALYCKQAGRTALGTVQFLGCCPGLVVANLFCQDEELARVPGGICITDYEMMRKCFKRVNSMAQLQRMKVYIPRNIGCGIAAGDWAEVMDILHEVFDDSPVDAFIVAREGC